MFRWSTEHQGVLIRNLKQMRKQIPKLVKDRVFEIRLIQFLELAAHGDASWLTLICRLTSGPVQDVTLEWSML